jgi:uncharacterized protein YoxC
MAEDKLAKDIRATVDDVFKQKEEVEMRAQIEESLNKSADKINELTASLEAKDTELEEALSRLEELEESLTELSNSNKELTSNLEKATSGFEAEKAELIERAETAENELEGIKKNQIAQARFDELKKVGVAATDEKAIEDQIAKVRDMEEEAFEAYKSERVELRNSIIAELENSSEKEEETTSDLEEEEENASENDEEAVADSEDAIQNTAKAMASLMNMEKAPSADMISKYHELGKEMAKKYENK